MIKKILLVVAFLFISTINAQNIFQINYSLFSITKNGEIGGMMHTKASVVYDYPNKKITIYKPEKERDIYKIISAEKAGLTKDGMPYRDVITTNGIYNFHFRFTENFVMIINTTTRNGLTLYK